MAQNPNGDDTPEWLQHNRNEPGWRYCLRTCSQCLSLICWCIGGITGNDHTFGPYNPLEDQANQAEEHQWIEFDYRAIFSQVGTLEDTPARLVSGSATAQAPPAQTTAPISISGQGNATGDGPGDVTGERARSRQLLQEQRRRQRYSEMVEALRRGRQLKDWIDDPALGHCQYNMSDLQFNRMVREDRWEAVANDQVDPEARYWALEFQNLGLPMEGERYRQRRIRKHGIRSYNGSRGFNDYEMSTGQGCLIIQDIRRFDGPRFYELAVAQYKQDNRNDMSTLKHIFVENIVNDVTVDFMRKQFWGNITQNKYETTANLPRLEFAYNSDLYPAILGGTQFGIIAAQIVLGAFQRGTHRISRIVAWKSDGAFQMRFDIEPIHG